MKKRITKHLMENPSYFKWSNTRLATKYGCSEATMARIVDSLNRVKTNYLNTLKGA